MRSRLRRGASTTNGRARPAVTFTATPATSTLAAARQRGLVPAVSASATASSNSSSVSLWAPPTASTRTTGLSPTNAAAQRAEWPARAAARAISAIAPRLHSAENAFSTHSPPASPSGAVA